jgi:POT family proton-dependent oligopeptide transporter
MAQPKTAPDHNITTFPPGVPYIIGNEGCERFSFYGMKCILYGYLNLLFLMNGLEENLAKSHGTETVHLFIAGCYGLPIVGALFADRLLGKYNTILWLSIVYTLGHAVLSFTEGTLWGMYLGLGLIALGAGGIKPCVSAHVGDQFGRGNWHLLSKVFNAFYWIINFGSFFATLMIPIIKAKWGYSVAFAIPGVLMGIATFVFWLGRHKFIHVPATPGGKLGLLDALGGSFLFMATFGHPIFFAKLTDGVALDLAFCGGYFGIFLFLFNWRQKIKPDDGFLAITLSCVFDKLKSKEKLPPPPPVDGGEEAQKLSQHWFFGSAVHKYGADLVQGPKAVFKIVSVFFLISVFWGLFDQHSSTWLQQAETMDRAFVFDLSGWLYLTGISGFVVGIILVLAFAKSSAQRLLYVTAAFAVGLLAGYLAHGNGLTFVIDTDQTQLLNPLLVMILIPIVNFGVYPGLERMGIRVTALRKMSVGMFIAAIGFGAVALTQSFIDESNANGEQVHVLWQVFQYVIMTLAEVLVSITGLEFAYSQAPKRMKSTIMGFWLLMVALGNVLVAVIVKNTEYDPGTPDFFWLFAGLMAVAAVFFTLRASFYKYQSFEQ